MKTKPKLLAKISKYVLLSLLAAVVLYNLYTIYARFALNEQVPKALGFANAVVISGSMEPKLHVGDMVIIRESKSYAVGDTVTYVTGRTPITHEIIEITENGFITQGISNNMSDAEIARDQVVGKVIAVIPKIGFLIDFLRSALGVFVIVVAGALIVEFPHWLKKRREVRSENQGENREQGIS